MSDKTTRAAIVAAYVAGASVKDLALEHHRSVSSVYDMLRDAGVVRPQGPRKVPLPPEAIAEYQDGGGLSEIATRHGMSVYKLRARLEDAGVKRPRRPAQPPRQAAQRPRRRSDRRLTDEQVLEARRRYVAGATGSELAAELGITREAMRLALSGRTYAELPGAVAMREQHGRPSMPLAERIARIVKLGREGVPVGVITAKTGDNRARVLAALADAGIEPVIPPRKSRGSARPDAKLVEADVADAREQYRAGMNGSELARRFGITSAAMNNALRGFTWSHVPRPVTDEEWRGRYWHSGPP